MREGIQLLNMLGLVYCHNVEPAVCYMICVLATKRGCTL